MQRKKIHFQSILLAYLEGNYHIRESWICTLRCCLWVWGPDHTCSDVSLGFLAALVHLSGQENRRNRLACIHMPGTKENTMPCSVVRRLPAVIKLSISAWALRWALFKESKRLLSKIPENLKRRSFSWEAKIWWLKIWCFSFALISTVGYNTIRQHGFVHFEEVLNF